MANIMLDLETMGNRGTSAIISIGAVQFSPSGIGKEFYKTVNLDSCMKAGLTIDASTIAWWMQQSEEAKTSSMKGELSLFQALQEFTKFIGGTNSDAKIWGNGADFDNAILANAYRASNLEVPWKHWNNRCYRTMKSVFAKAPKPEFSGEKHNALDDAKFQATHLISIMSFIKG
jgi:hypothetical protein